MHYKFGRKSGGLVEKDGSLMSELTIITDIDHGRKHGELGGST